jgi:Lar family restriction alleviation protein
MTDELKACPFCGGEALLDWECSGIKTVSWAVSCCACGVFIGTSTSKKHIIEQWNQRTHIPISKAIEAVKEALKYRSCCCDLEAIKALEGLAK